MRKAEAKKYLDRACRNGYVPYHTGLVLSEGQGQKENWGINIDGDGREGRLFGCPKIIWDAGHAEEMFPARAKKLSFSKD